MPIPITAREPVSVPIPSLVESNPDFRARITIPTPYQRDLYTSELVRNEVVFLDQSQIRDMVLSGVVEIHGEEAFDDARAMLEHLWQAGDDQKRVANARQLMLIDLMEQNEALPEKKRLTEKKMLEKLESIKLQVVIAEPKRLKAVTYQNEIIAEYGPLQKAMGSLADMDAKRHWYNIEHYCCGFIGLEHDAEGNGQGGLTRHEAEYLRDNVGEVPFAEISDFITSLMGIDKDEEKNLASLLENYSDPTGSNQSTDQASSDGTSTGGTSTKTQEKESPKTTGPSSASTTKAAKKTGASKAGQTGKR